MTVVVLLIGPCFLGAAMTRVPRAPSPQARVPIAHATVVLPLALPATKPGPERTDRCPP